MAPMSQMGALPKGGFPRSGALGILGTRAREDQAVVQAFGRSSIPASVKKMLLAIHGVLFRCAVDSQAFHAGPTGSKFLTGGSSLADLEGQQEVGHRRL